MSGDRRDSGMAQKSTPLGQGDGDLTTSHQNSYDLPPITLNTPHTTLQQHLAGQAWDRVSARQPVGSQADDPDEGVLVENLSAIMEMRLADVVKHRIQLLKPPNVARKLPRVSDSSIASEKAHDSLFERGKTIASENSQSGILLTTSCRKELRAFVHRIASMYRDNRYHCLEHATHVTMSAHKLLHMLHEGAEESDSDDNEVTEMNDFSVSEPLIHQSFNESRPSREELQFNLSDSMLTFPSRYYGYPSSETNSSSQHLYCEMLTNFAFVFAAMIHDVDHQGVPNTRLIKEKDPLVEIHGHTSVAEKHSIQIAFQTLNETEYDDFRSTIFSSPDDYLHMHRIVTNVVVSTDIASAERMHSTTLRWQAAFSRPISKTVRSSLGKLSLAGKSPLSEIATVHASKPQLVPVDIVSTVHNGGDESNTLKRVLDANGGKTSDYFSNISDDDNARMALQQSVIIETMLNVADVAHSMQSWELFLFWNRRLFEELYIAFKVGRSDTEPSVDWFENQLGFFKIYVIPLAEKMRQCKAFGALSGEWVKNATLIRDRWEIEGEQITKDMIASVKRNYH